MCMRVYFHMCLRRRRHPPGEHFFGVQGQHPTVRRLRSGELHRQRRALARSGAAAATRRAQAHPHVAGATGEECKRRRELEDEMG